MNKNYYSCTVHDLLTTFIEYQYLTLVFVSRYLIGKLIRTPPIRDMMAFLHPSYSWS